MNPFTTLSHVQYTLPPLLADFLSRIGGIGFIRSLRSKKKGNIMYDEPKLSDEEWDLIVELVECERSELPVEIHHTCNANVRAELQRRAEVVRKLLERLRQMVTV